MLSWKVCKDCINNLAATSNYVINRGDEETQEWVCPVDGVEHKNRLTKRSLPPKGCHRLMEHGVATANIAKNKRNK